MFELLGVLTASRPYNRALPSKNLIHLSGVQGRLKKGGGREVPRRWTGADGQNGWKVEAGQIV